MKVHKLKIKEEYFNEVKEGRKTFEIRKNDRDYKVGDVVILTKVDNEGFLTREVLVGTITYLLKNCPQYGLGCGYCIFSLKINKVNGGC